jgi:hypothetical protein
VSSAASTKPESVADRIPDERKPPTITLCTRLLHSLRFWDWRTIRLSSTGNTDAPKPVNTASGAWYTPVPCS